jgi:hypothetical protein
MTNAYPEGIRACKELDILSSHLLQGHFPNDELSFMLVNVLQKLREYSQEMEKKHYEFEKPWHIFKSLL